MTNFSIKTVRIWLGGSFDPVHLGHLAIIEHITDVLNGFLISQETQNLNIIISLLPTARNPLKTTPTDNHHRLAMLELGLKELQQNWQHLSSIITFQIDTTEIYQTDTVFTFNTFNYFRQIYPNDSLIFVLGMDSILAFERWYRAFELPNLCHLWIMPRAVEAKENLAEKSPILPNELQPFLTDDLQGLILTKNGHIYLDNYQVMSVSSSHIRAILQDKAILLEDKKLRLQPYLSPSVLDYILVNNLYN